MKSDNYTYRPEVGSLTAGFTTTAIAQIKFCKNYLAMLPIERQGLPYWGCEGRDVLDVCRIIRSICDGYCGPCFNNGPFIANPYELCRYGSTTPGVTASPLRPEALRNRLPAIRLTDLIARERTLNRSTGSCSARWDDTGTVPVRCGSDKTRYLVANLGSNGRSDSESWPALDANNATATRAVVELFQDGGEVRVRCSPRWIRRDGSQPPSPPFNRNLDYRGPVVQSTLVTQTGKPFLFRIREDCVLRFSPLIDIFSP